MRFLVLIVLLFSFTANAQVDAAEEKKLDSAMGELCTCFNTIISSFDPKFRDVFLMSVDNPEKGKALIQEYFTSLDSVQKYSFKRDLEVKILNPDSELTKCGKVLIDKYQINITVASDEQKKYMVDKLNNTENCGVMSKIIIQQLGKKKQ